MFSQNCLSEEIMHRFFMFSILIASILCEQKNFTHGVTHDHNFFFFFDTRLSDHSVNQIFYTYVHFVTVAFYCVGIMYTQARFTEALELSYSRCHDKALRRRVSSWFSRPSIGNHALFVLFGSHIITIHVRKVLRILFIG